MMALGKLCLLVCVLQLAYVAEANFKGLHIYGPYNPGPYRPRPYRPPPTPEPTQGYVITEPADPGCTNIVLRSSGNSADREQIKDANGNPAEIISMELLKQLSKTKCIEWVNYFFFGSYVVAKKGCSGRFRVCYKVVEPTTKAPLTVAPAKPTCRKYIITEDGETTVTDANGEPVEITSVTLIKEISYKRCYEWITYFYEGSKFEVKGGCRGAFKVCYEEPMVTTAAPDPGCINVVLRSTYGQADQETINDASGDPAEIISMDLIKQLSEKPCIEWKSFFFVGSRVVAKFGCAGRFRVCYKVEKPQPTKYPVITAEPGCTLIRLLSRVNRRDTENAGAEVSSITLVREFSKGICKEGENFGSRGRIVFASSGCRGDFSVCTEQQLTTTPRPEIPGCRYVKLLSRVNQPVWRDVKDKDGNPVRVKSIQLVKQLPGAPCVEWENYYARGYKIHASDGCRGEFLVCIYPQSGGYAYWHFG